MEKTKKERIAKLKIPQFKSGAIAQEIEDIYPEAILNRTDGLKAIEYTKLIPLMIKAIQDLSKKIGDK